MRMRSGLSPAATNRAAGVTPDLGAEMVDLGGEFCDFGGERLTSAGQERECITRWGRFDGDLVGGCPTTHTASATGTPAVDHLHDQRRRNVHYQLRKVTKTRGHTDQQL